MNDLISREKVIEICHDLQGVSSNRDERSGISKVWKGVKNIPTAFDIDDMIKRIKENSNENNRIDVDRAIKIIKDCFNE